VPTLSHRIVAELFVESRFLATVNTRYQYQTWGGARSPESRLTDELGLIRNRAQGGDILLIQRSIEDLERYRLILVRQSSSEFPEINRLASGRRWGALSGALPLSDPDLLLAEQEQRQRETEPLVLIEPDPPVVESSTRRIARSVAFRRRLLELYDGRCCICGSGLRTPDSRLECDAAHIVPRSRAGADDARNGLALCKTHHWAFDQGLFGVDGSRRVVVPRAALRVVQNDGLNAVTGVEIREAKERALQASDKAFQWHRSYVLIQ
jgi:putative restriction endonuclease